ncbi:MAG TPA: lipid A biosynthesis acyltransferase [bacterium]|nr:lipid A biosynthesis acyltransferase [bacterium]HPS30147.1 lipid A biosynthesis acyltransferase [bacterium]
MSKWTGKSRGGSTGYKLFNIFLKYGGLPLAYFVLKFVALYFMVSAPVSVKSLYRYFRTAHNYGRFRSFYSIYLNFIALGETIIDRMAVIMGMSDKFSFNFEDEPVLRKSVESTEGCLMISAHVGNWQVAQAFLHRFSRNKVNIVMLDVENERIKQFIKNSVGGDNVNILLMNKGMDYLLDLVKAFKNKEVVCLHGDRFIEGSRTAEVDFFSMKAEFPLGPFALAKKFKVPASFTFVMKTGRKNYSFYATEAKVYDNEAEMMADFVKSLENILKKYPLQWYNYFPFWKVEQ